jgi:hypothetical protein
MKFSEDLGRILPGFGLGLLFGLGGLGTWEILGQGAGWGGRRGAKIAVEESPQPLNTGTQQPHSITLDLDLRTVDASLQRQCHITADLVNLGCGSKSKAETMQKKSISILPQSNAESNLKN